MALDFNRFYRVRNVGAMSASWVGVVVRLVRRVHGTEFVSGNAMTKVRGQQDGVEGWFFESEIEPCNYEYPDEVTDETVPDA